MGLESFLPWAVLLSPIVGFLIQAFLGRALARRFGKGLVGTLAVIPIVISFVCGLLLLLNLQSIDVAVARSMTFHGFTWISAGPLNIPFDLLIDPLSILMVLIITGVGALIHLYATAYMADDKDYARFFTYMNLFVASMLLLVMGSNLALLFVGWEGVGLCSYLLIGFWYTDLANAKAANKAFIVNRIGDWGLMLGLFLIVAILVSPGSKVPIRDGQLLNYDSIEGPLHHAFALHPYLATSVALLLFIGAAGKSAQFPLYLWLPDAMAGPTPVSALIHAATMVTSGVFLVNRMHFVFEMSPVASAIMACVGAFTALWAALIAFGQTDIKRVLAYSTVSQLGFMFIACGSGEYWAGMFHVTTHAFFKALLFLGSGAVIYSMAHNQDMRNYGNLRKYLPLTFWAMAIGWLAISGFPLLSGFYSKDAILGGAINGDQAVLEGLNLGAWAGWLGLFVALLTAAYMSRLMSLTFFGKERWLELPEAGHVAQDGLQVDHQQTLVAGTVTFGVEPLADPFGFYTIEAEKEVHDDHHELDSHHTPGKIPLSMSFTLVVLAIASAIGGWALNYHDALKNWLYPISATIVAPSEKPGAVPVMWLSTGAALLGLAFGLWSYRRGLPRDQSWDLAKWQPWRRAELNQFGFDSAMTQISVEGGRDASWSLWKWFDVAIVDRIVNGFGWVAELFGRALAQSQTGYVRLYALVMLFGGVCFVGWFVYLIGTGGGH